MTNQQRIRVVAMANTLTDSALETMLQFESQFYGTDTDTYKAYMSVKAYRTITKTR